MDVSLTIGVIHRGAFIEQLRLVFERQKGVPEARWNPDLVVLDGIDLKGFPGAKGRTLVAQINHHIQGTTATNPDQLSLGLIPLKMNPAQHACLRHRMVVLNPRSMQTQGG